MLIVVSEKQPGTLLIKKAKASDVVNYLQPVQPQQTSTLLVQPVNPNKAHLDSMGIVQVFGRTDLSDQDYKQYLDSTPPGLVFELFIYFFIEILFRSNGICLGTSKKRKS
jgi:hypothetical protein